MVAREKSRKRSYFTHGNHFKQLPCTVANISQWLQVVEYLHARMGHKERRTKSPRIENNAQKDDPARTFESMPQRILKRFVCLLYGNTEDALLLSFIVAFEKQADPMDSRANLDKMTYIDSKVLIIR